MTVPHQDHAVQEIKLNPTSMDVKASKHHWSYTEVYSDVMTWLNPAGGKQTDFLEGCNFNRNQLRTDTSTSPDLAPSLPWLKGCIKLSSMGQVFQLTSLSSLRKKKVK